MAETEMQADANALAEAVKNRDDEGWLLLWEQLGPDRQWRASFYLARLVAKLR